MLVPGIACLRIQVFFLGTGSRVCEMPLWLALWDVFIRACGGFLFMIDLDRGLPLCLRTLSLLEVLFLLRLIERVLPICHGWLRNMGFICPEFRRGLSIPLFLHFLGCLLEDTWLLGCQHHFNLLYIIIEPIKEDYQKYRDELRSKQPESTPPWQW